MRDQLPDAPSSSRGAPMAGRAIPANPFDVPIAPPGNLLRLHRQMEEGLTIAETLGDKEMAAAIRERLSQRVHVDINDLRAGHRKPRQHWSTSRSYGFGVACILAAAFVASLFVAALISAWGQM